MDELRSKVVVSAAVTRLVRKHLEETARDTGLTKSVLIEQGLRLFFGSRDGNEWIARMKERHEMYEACLQLGLDPEKGAVDGVPALECCVSPYAEAGQRDDR